MLSVMASAPIEHKAASDLEIFYSLHLPFQSGRRIFLKVTPHVFYEIGEVSRKSVTTETCFLLYQLMSSSLEVQVVIFFFFFNCKMIKFSNSSPVLYSFIHLGF